MLLAEPTYNRTRFAALAWRARILSQKALPNVPRLTRLRAAAGGRFEIAWGAEIQPRVSNSSICRKIE
jgi:hypothetical protein